MDVFGKRVCGGDVQKGVEGGKKVGEKQIFVRWKG